MRIRTVKPDFWPHRMHSRISEPAALLALGLLNMADDEGRFEADPQAITVGLFPRRALSKPLADCLAELVAARWIVIYDGVVDGHKTQIGQVTKFSRHQVINKWKASGFAAPPAALLRESDGSTTVALPDSSRHEAGSDTSRVNSNGTGALPPLQEGLEPKEGKGVKDVNTRPPDLAKPFPEAEIPTLEQVLAYCGCAAGIPAEIGREFWDYYEKTAYPQWTDKGGARFQWRGRLQKWAAQERGNKGGPAPSKNASSQVQIDQLEAEFACEKNPAKREKLRAELKRLGA